MTVQWEYVPCEADAMEPGVPLVQRPAVKRVAKVVRWIVGMVILVAVEWGMLLAVIHNSRLR